MVIRRLKGAFHQDHHIHAIRKWNVDVVTAYIRSKMQNKRNRSITSYKLAMLITFTRPSRSGDLAQLSLNHRRYTVKGVTFLPIALSNQSRQQKHGTVFHLPSYPPEPPFVSSNVICGSMKHIRQRYTTPFRYSKHMRYAVPVSQQLRRQMSQPLTSLKQQIGPVKLYPEILPQTDNKLPVRYGNSDIIIDATLA